MFMLDVGKLECGVLLRGAGSKGGGRYGSAASPPDGLLAALLCIVDTLSITAIDVLIVYVVSL